MSMKKELEELWAQLTEEQKAICLERLKTLCKQVPVLSAPA